MNRWKSMVAVFVIMFVTLLALSSPQPSGAKRNIIMKQDLSNFPGHEGVVAQVELAPGAQEPKHTHPGDIFGYVQEGTLTLDVDGQGTASVKPGEVFFVPAGKVHWGKNEGTRPIKIITTFLVEKGKPLVSPAQ